MAGVETYLTTSSAETYQLGVLLGQKLSPGSVVCFFGDLGAGKTTMIKGIVAGAGCGGEGGSGVQVTSPTYTYLHVYKGPKTVYHFDLYRLPGEEEFLAMGFDEYFDAGGICCLEWSEKIPGLVGEHVVRVEIAHTGDDRRNIRITGSL